MSTLRARHALITGANRGLGLEWVRQLVTEVDSLFATCRRPGEATALDELEATYPDRLVVLGLDVTNPDDIEKAAARVGRTTGSLDLLVNNAGINGSGTADRFGRVRKETMLEVLDVNTIGPHLMTQAFADLLRTAASDEPAIVVNVTSQLGSIANTSGGGWHSYRASKAALNMCTRLQAGALKNDGVIVVSMHPGWVRTDMGGSSARLSPEDSVEGMIDVLGTLTVDDAGRFLAYDGRQLPW